MTSKIMAWKKEKFSIHNDAITLKPCFKVDWNDYYKDAKLTLNSFHLILQVLLSLPKFLFLHK